MTDRLVADAVRAGSARRRLARLQSLRRRLWWRRAVRSGLLALAAAAVLLAVVQLRRARLPPRAARVDPSRRRGARRRWRGLRTRSAAAHRSSRPRAAPTRSSGCGSASAPRSSWPRRESDDPLVARQLADARTRLNAVDLRRAFRPSLARRPLAIAGVGMAMTLLLVAWPNPQDQVIDQRRAAREAAERVAERVEEIADEIGEENVENPDPASRGARARAARARPPAPRAGRRPRGDPGPHRLGAGSAVADDRPRGLRTRCRADAAGTRRSRGRRPATTRPTPKETPRRRRATSRSSPRNPTS